MIAVFGITIALVVGRFLRGGADVASWTEHAAHTGNVDLLVEHIEKGGDSRDAATEWDQAIGALWQSYNRETAAQLVIEGAKRSDAPVIQYWIRRFIEVEPEIAATHFTEGFLRDHFRPDVAASCGKSCGCG
jgi:hypothetical protein